nr:GNAT family N-acetyltransferase [Petropleomorpha daqingensis]
MVAFSDARHADGTLLDDAAARALGVVGEHQVAALRWWPRRGLINQIYVAPEHRRLGIAAKLGHAAFALQRARGLPDLTADGRRTDLGERFREGLPAYAAWRLAPRTHRQPPMDGAA